MQSAGQRSPSAVFPSSQSSPGSGSPLPQGGISVTHSALHPSPDVVLLSSQVSEVLLVTPSPQNSMMHTALQPSPGSRSPSSQVSPVMVSRRLSPQSSRPRQSA